MSTTHSREPVAEKRASRRQIPWQLRLLRLAFSTLGPILPGPMGRWAYRSWFQTRRYPVPAVEQQAQARAARLTLPVNGIPVAVYGWGAGPVVLFVHGWAGRGTQVVHFIAPLLQAGFRVVAFDAPAHGDTPGKRTDIFECAAALQAVVRECGPAYGIITHSFGGMVLAYALHHGVAAGRVACISAPANLEFLVDSFARALAIPGTVMAVLRRLQEQRFGGNLSELISTESNARTLTVPALVIHDVNDYDVPWQQGRRIAVAWPGARFRKTRGLGHRRILRDPDTIEAVVEFFAAP